METDKNSTDETTVNVGRQIRYLRVQQKLSQQSLADMSGLSRNTLSLLERGQTSPTVSTLKRLAIALAVDINAFFGAMDDESIILTRATQRPTLQLLHGWMADLGVGKHVEWVTPLLLRLDPGARSGPPLSHSGQDFIYCLRGEVLYTVNENAFVLEPGDSILFDSRLPHRFQNTSKEDSEILIILSVPHESAEYISNHFPEVQNDKQ
jgi:transcriptional regulator with XRE-family HTH domain